MPATRKHGIHFIVSNTLLDLVIKWKLTDSNNNNNNNRLPEDSEEQNSKLLWHLQEPLNNFPTLTLHET